MNARIRLLLACGILATTWWGAPAWAQSSERKSRATVTGPGGRTVRREVESSRRPGSISREVRVERPGGTLQREVHVQRGPGPIAPRPAGPPRGGILGRGPTTIVQQRNVFVNRSGVIREQPIIVERGGGNGLGWGLFGGLAGFALGMAAASPPPPPPPPVAVVPSPVYVTPAPVYVTPAPTVVVPQPAPAQAPQVVETQPAFDPYADALGRLQSHHDNSRRDGALTLGQIGDPRAVPALLELLSHDRDDDVRAAAATALGQIGDARALAALERAAAEDRDRDVRQAAARAYALIPTPISSPAPAPDAGPVPAAPASLPTPAPPAPVVPQ